MSEPTLNCDPAIRQRLVDYINAQLLLPSDRRQTIRLLARRIGYSEGVLSPYLAAERDDAGRITTCGTCTYPGNVAKLEQKVLRFLSTIAVQPEFGVELIDGGVYRKVAGALGTIRRSRTMGLVHGPAGLGKSSSITRYAAMPDHEDDVLISAQRWARTPFAIERLIADAAPRFVSRRKPGRGLGEHLADRLRGTESLFIVDNAHLLTAAALVWWANFRDVTGCAVAYVGNPEIMGLVRRNDQVFSRLGHCDEVTYASIRDPEKLVRHQLEQLAPEAPAAEVLPELLRCAAEPGHFRLVRQVLVSAAVIKDDAADSVTWLDAVKAAKLSQAASKRWED